MFWFIAASHFGDFHPSGKPQNRLFCLLNVSGFTGLELFAKFSLDQFKPIEINGISAQNSSGIFLLVARPELINALLFARRTKNYEHLFTINEWRYTKTSTEAN